MRHCINTSTDAAYTDIHNSNVPSLRLEQQHEELCSNTPRGGPSQTLTTENQYNPSTHTVELTETFHYENC